MERKKEMNQLLDLIDRPALCIRNGQIYLLNRAATQLGFEVDHPIGPLLGQAAEEYERFHEGSLFLNLQRYDLYYAASVFRVEGHDIFVIEQEMDHQILDALALAAMKLRDPLSDINAIIDQLSPLIRDQEGDTAQHYLDVLHRRMFQIHRMVCNMSDASRYVSSSAPKLEYVELCSTLEDLLDRIEALTSAVGIKLTWDLPLVDVPTMADVERLERAVYNMISNAMKATPTGGTIHVTLKRRKERAYLSVRDHGAGIDPQITGSAFTRFRRPPGLESFQEGLGLGMTLICCGAAAHGGTVLIDHPADGGTRVTMSIPLRRSTDSMVRSDTLIYDYAGEQDHGLLELSDILPPEAYRDPR
ncbi:MAG: HAMP domain-containing histidine kinase [Oscillospiraceae bacterium]|nr:HAMP domain-containing histidine kinase [Oscillospiraceae bacterium]